LDGKIAVSCGCFYVYIDEFVKQVNERHGDDNYGNDYRAMIEMAKMHFGIKA